MAVLGDTDKRIGAPNRSTNRLPLSPQCCGWTMNLHPEVGRRPPTGAPTRSESIQAELSPTPSRGPVREIAPRVHCCRWMRRLTAGEDPSDRRPEACRRFISTGFADYIERPTTRQHALRQFKGRLELSNLYGPILALAPTDCAIVGVSAVLQLAPMSSGSRLNSSNPKAPSGLTKISTHRSTFGVEGLATTFHDLSSREDMRFKRSVHRRGRGSRLATSR